MGIRINNKVNMIPVKLCDGVLKFDIGGYEFEQDIPELRGRSAKLQCTFVYNNFVRAYIYDSDRDEIYLLRDDDTGTIYSARDKYLYKHFNYDWKIGRDMNWDALNEKPEKFGGMLENIDGARADCRMCVLQNVGGSKYILSFTEMPIVITFDGKEEQAYFKALRSISGLVPTFWIRGQELIVTDGRGTEIYTFNAKLIRDKGILSL